MDLPAFLNTLLATDTPVLPDLAAMRLAQHAVWALVLGAGTLWAAGRLPRPYRLGLVVGVMLWALVPGPASPTHWLALALQTPSLTGAVLGGVWLYWGCAVRGAGGCAPAPSHPALTGLAAMAVVLGWVLLLDTLAWFPVSVYAWGFSAAAVGALAGVVVLLWVVLGGAGAGSKGAWGGWVAWLLPASVLALFVVTRLPTGNVWDALLDPVLWAALQVGGVVSVLRRWWRARRLSPAIRA